MMMGIQTAPAQLFYDFCLDDHVPEGHLLRRIDRFLDLEKVRTELKPFYSSIGRPSIAPELMMRMLIVGYCMGIRSERRLCEEIHLNLAYRWFCGLGLDGRVPDHSTFSRNRHGRFRQSNILRHLFETVVERCLREGLVGGEGFAVDASLIAADANKQRSVPGDQWPIAGLGADAGRAVREYAIRWREQSNLPPEHLRSFYFARQHITDHCCAQRCHMVWVMTQRISSAFEPLLIVPKKEVGETQPGLCLENVGIERA
jgi:transposase